MKLLGIKISESPNIQKGAWEVWEIEFCKCGNHACRTLVKVDTKENILKMLEKEK